MWNYIPFPLAGRLQYLLDICLLLYVQPWTPDDGRKDRPKHVELHQNKINSRHWCIWLVLLQKYVMMQVAMNVKLHINLVPSTDGSINKQITSLVKHQTWHFRKLQVKYPRDSEAAILILSLFHPTYLIYGVSIAVNFIVWGFQFWHCVLGLHKIWKKRIVIFLILGCTQSLSSRGLWHARVSLNVSFLCTKAAHFFVTC